MTDRGAIIKRYFRRIYSDMLRRIEEYKRIQQIENLDLRRKKESIFLEEQRAIVKRFIANEEHSRRVLKRGLKLQQRDIEGWWKRNVEFRRVKHNCIDRFDNLIAFAKKVEEILDKGLFEQKDAQTLISEIENELKAIIHLSDDYEIRKYGQGILELCKRNKSPIALTILFIFVSSLAVYTFTNYNITPQYTQTVQVSFTADDMYASDWAEGEHKTYGFYIMIDRIVDTYLGRKGEHKSYLEGLQYRAKEDQRYGNLDVNILEIYGGASKLLPNDMKNALGDNIIMEVQALNKGEIVIVILQDNNIILNVRFVQDKPQTPGTNSYNYSNQQLEEIYHAVRLGIEKRVNEN